MRLDEQTEAARLAAARREALESLIADLRRRYAENKSRQQRFRVKWRICKLRSPEDEAARLVEAAAAQALRERLANADAELTAMTLALEEERRKAEETLTLLAAAQSAEDEQLSEAEAREALLAEPRARLAEEQEIRQRRSASRPC